MPNHKDFQLNYRPESYWDDNVNGFTNIKGELRRQIIENAFREGNIDILPASIFSDKLSNEERKFTGSIHPAFMGGEYLPDYLDGEVEIVRVSLKSVTYDVYSIRAKKADDGRINYRMVDECESWDNEYFKLKPEITLKPFTFGELVSFINNVEWNDDDGACKGLTTRFRDMSFDPDSPVMRELEDLANFVSVSSFFYPDLIRWYENEAVEWFVDRLTEIDSMHSV